jgi:hypothetical protein
MDDERMLLTDVTISIPFKGAGNSIIQKTVQFEVYRKSEHYLIRPALETADLRLANLPEEMEFAIKEGKVESLRGKKDGNLHVMQDVYAALSDKNFKTL